MEFGRFWTISPHGAPELQNEHFLLVRKPKKVPTWTRAVFGPSHVWVQMDKTGNCKRSGNSKKRSGDGLRTQKHSGKDSKLWEKCPLLSLSQTVRCILPGKKQSGKDLTKAWEIALGRTVNKDQKCAFQEKGGECRVIALGVKLGPNENKLTLVVLLMC